MTVISKIIATKQHIGKMNHGKNISILAMALFSLSGCNPFESTYDKQVKACIIEAKKDLGMV